MNGNMGIIEEITNEIVDPTTQQDRHTAGIIDQHAGRPTRAQH